MDATLVFVAGGVLGGMAIGAAGATAYFVYSNFHDRIAKLEDMNGKRLSHKTAALLEDAMAVAMDIDQTEKYIEVRRNQLMQIMQIARVAPQNYDVDKPNGKGKR